jgi:hypothetical protein
MKYLLPLAAAALALAGCYRNVDETVITVDCGATALEFTVNEFRGPPDMPLSHFPKLSLLRTGLPPVLADRLYGKRRVEVYAHLPADDKFHLFPPLDNKARARPAVHHLQDIFIDPAVFSTTEYEGIKTCVEKNLPAIDAAFDRPLFDGEYIPRLRLRAILHRAYEDGFAFCGEETLGLRFDCSGGRAYIKTVLPGGLQLCRAGSRATNAKDLIGRLSADGRSAQLRAPGSTGPADHPDYGLKTLAGPDWRGFYAACRDREGKNLFDHFKTEPWKN